MDVSINIYYKKYNGTENPEVAEITTFGDGELDHFLQTFRTILVAVGYDIEDSLTLGFLGGQNDHKTHKFKRPLGCNGSEEKAS